MARSPVTQGGDNALPQDPDGRKAKRVPACPVRTAAPRPDLVADAPPIPCSAVRTATRKPRAQHPKGPGFATVDLSVNKRFPDHRTFSTTGPVGSAGRITSTLTAAPQIQLGLKLIF